MNDQNDSYIDEMKEDLRRLEESGELQKRIEELREKAELSEEEISKMKDMELTLDGQPLNKEQSDDLHTFLSWFLLVSRYDVNHKWLTIEKVAQRFNVSKKQVEKWIASRELDAVKDDNGEYRIGEETIHNFLMNRNI